MEFSIWREMAWLVGLVALALGHHFFGAQLLTVFTFTYFAHHPVFSIVVGGLAAIGMLGLFMFGADKLNDAVNGPRR